MSIVENRASKLAEPCVGLTEVGRWAFVEAFIGLLMGKVHDWVTGAASHTFEFIQIEACCT